MDTIVMQVSEIQEMQREFERLANLVSHLQVQNSVLRSREIFVLLADADGTTRSIDRPFGVAVSTKAEADRYIEEGGVGYSHSFTRVKVYPDKDEALHDVYHRGQFPKDEDNCEFCKDDPLPELDDK